MPSVQVTRVVFTHNNYDADVQARYVAFAEQYCGYMVYGREVGDSGTPHLQGFFILKERRVFSFLNAQLPGSHKSIARGTSHQAADYCKKDGDYFEHGELVPLQVSPMRVCHAWINSFVDEHGRAPSPVDFVTSDISFHFMFHRKKLLEYANDRAQAVAPFALVEGGELRPGWQVELCAILDAESDDRSINFVVGPDGGEGKSWFQKWYLQEHRDRCQLLGSGKRDDLAHSVDCTKTVFLMNVCRTGMEYLSYRFLEDLKDRLVFSPKYDSRMKLLLKTPHVVVFCNEHPDMDKLSVDRYNIIDI